MSKSDPSSSIFMDDDEDEVNLKIKEAYCPTKVVQGNPCLEYIRDLIFPRLNEFKVERNPDDGGNKIYMEFEELVADFENGDLNPVDLKPALSRAINKILHPVRDLVANNTMVKYLFELVKEFRVTR